MTPKDVVGKFVKTYCGINGFDNLYSGDGSHRYNKDTIFYIESFCHVTENKKWIVFKIIDQDMKNMYVDIDTGVPLEKCFEIIG